MPRVGGTPTSPVIACAGKEGGMLLSSVFSPTAWASEESACAFLWDPDNVCGAQPQVGPFAGEIQHFKCIYDI